MWEHWSTTASSTIIAIVYIQVRVDMLRILVCLTHGKGTTGYHLVMTHDFVFSLSGLCRGSDQPLQQRRHANCFVLVKLEFEGFSVFQRTNVVFFRWSNLGVISILKPASTDIKHSEYGRLSYIANFPNQGSWDFDGRGKDDSHQRLLAARRP